MKMYIGTSGFSYLDWKKSFYPEGLPASKWLQYYSTKFNTQELNYTFYRFPKVKPLQTIYKSTPDDFIFSLKAHRIITHSMRLHNAKDKIREFIDIVNEGLSDKLACVLFQMPPSFKYSEEHLDHILESVEPSARHVIEFRHSSWWCDEALHALKKHKLTFCNVSFPNLPEDFYKTTSTIYIRMHGVPVLFASPYSDEQLEAMLGKIPRGAKECFIYFNNTADEAAIRNAFTTQKLYAKS